MPRRSNNMTMRTAPRAAPWPPLQRDEPICLVDRFGSRLSGRVDAMTEDRSTVWIQLDGGNGRRLVHHQDGYVLSNRPPEDAPPHSP